MPVSVYADGLACRFFSIENIHHERYCGKVNEASLLVSGYGHPSIDSSHDIFKAARKNGIQSAAVIDNWKGIERFFDDNWTIDYERLPDYIFVIDASLKKFLIDKKVPANIVFVVGHPVLEDFESKKIDHEMRSSDRKTLGIPQSIKLVAVASEKIHYHSYFKKCSSSAINPCIDLHEMRFRTKCVFDAITEIESMNGSDFILINRTHPNQKTDICYSQFDADYSRLDDYRALNMTDHVYGISSMFMFEGLCLGIKSTCLSGFIEDWQPERSYLQAQIWSDMNINYFHELSNQSGSKIKINENLFRGSLDNIVNKINDII